MARDQSADRNANAITEMKVMKAKKTQRTAKGRKTTARRQPAKAKASGKRKPQQKRSPKATAKRQQQKTRKTAGRQQKAIPAEQRRQANTTAQDGEVNELVAQMLDKVVKVGSSYQVDLDLWNKGNGGEPQNQTVWRRYSLPELRRSLALHDYPLDFIHNALARYQDDVDAKVINSAHHLDSLPLRPAGYQVIGDQEWFLDKDSSPIVPAKGDPKPVIKACCRLFGMEAPILIGWLRGCLESQLAYAAQARGQESDYRQRASQTLCVVGPPNTGKTNVLIKLIVEGLLGQSTSIPASWFNESNYFADFMMKSPVWVADDVAAFKCQAERKRGATRLKEVAYGSKFSVESKHRASFDANYPSTRIILCNDDELSLQRSLIDYNETPDKVLILHNSGDAGFKADYGGNNDKMNSTIREAIPAFAYWLLHSYRLPKWATATENSARHMVMDGGYVSPHVAAALSEFDDACILMQHIADVYARDKGIADQWLSQAELLDAIHEHVTKVYRPTSNMLGRSLAKCCERWGNLIEGKRRNQGMRFLLKKGAGWKKQLLCTYPKRVAQVDMNLLKAAGLLNDRSYRKELDTYIKVIDGKCC